MEYKNVRSLSENVLHKSQTYSGTDIFPSILCWNPINQRQEYHVFGDIQTITYSVHSASQGIYTLGRMHPRGFTRGPLTIAGSMIFTVFDKHALSQFTKGSSSSRRTGPTAMLPLFDIIMHMANEHGDESILVIYGIKILDEGQSHSIDDAYIENTMSFLAMDINLLERRENFLTPSNIKDYGLNVEATQDFLMSDIDYVLTTKNNLSNMQMNEDKEVYSTKNTYSLLGKR